MGEQSIYGGQVSFHLSVIGNPMHDGVPSGPAYTRWFTAFSMVSAERGAAGKRKLCPSLRSKRSRVPSSLSGSSRADGGVERVKNAHWRLAGDELLIPL